VTRDDDDDDDDDNNRFNSFLGPIKMVGMKTVLTSLFLIAISMPNCQLPAHVSVFHVGGLLYSSFTVITFIPQLQGCLLREHYGLGFT
jgi:hypothetical protein